MEAYTGFASVYDKFMDNIPYKVWCAYLIELLREFGVKDGLVLDLGCGTGNVTEILSRCGYDMIGIDNADEMLNIAMDKKAESGLDILYLNQDMRDFELYGTVKAVISICDSINYIPEQSELVQVFRLVNNYLDPGGIFIFDMNTEYKYREILDDCTIAENREECSFIWENYYDHEERINQYDLTIFVKEMQTGLYEKLEETHFQKAYALEEVISALEEAGMKYLTSYHAFSKEEPRSDSERVYIIAKENGKAMDMREEN